MKAGANFGASEGATAQGTLVVFHGFGFLRLDEPVGIRVDLLEVFLFSEKLLQGDVAIAVAINA